MCQSHHKMLSFRFAPILILCCVPALSVQAFSPGRSSFKKTAIPVSIGKVPDGTEERIVGGGYAIEGQFPYQVGFILDGLGVCGATLISEDIVLTAAHCLDGFSTFEVHLGALNLLNTSEQFHQVIMAESAIIHPGYALLETVTKDDIGFLRLSTPAILTDGVKTIRIPSRSQETETFVGLSGIVSGWGRDSDNATGPSADLKYTDTVSIVPNSDCQEAYGPDFGDTLLCVAKGVENSGACNSDSGGPVVVTDQDGELTQIGIVSFGKGLCASEFPAGYVRISSYLSWIESEAGVPIRP